MKKDVKISLRMSELDWHKMQFLARHDDTTFGQQMRQAVKVYLHNRKKTTFAINGENPIEPRG